MRAVFALLGCALLVGAGCSGAIRINRDAPAPRLDLHLLSTATTGPTGVAPAIPLPRTGSFVLEDGLGSVLASKDAERVRPIGSIAKAMTALMVLESHPLAGAEPGPTLTMTQIDVNAYKAAVAENGSSVEVKAGQRYTERDLLLAMMLPSANNIAETLARWVGPTRAAFLSRMNVQAGLMGMTSTHFADPSGMTPKTVSTAADLGVLARAVVGDPVLSSIVATSKATLSTGMVVYNLDALLGAPGWLGIKTGETDQAGACFLFAARRLIGEHSVTLVGAVLGQPMGLGMAFGEARKSIAAAFAGYVNLTIPAPNVEGGIITAWAETGLVQTSGEPQTVVLRSGDAVEYSLARNGFQLPLGTGARVGSVDALVHGMPVAHWDLVLGNDLKLPPVWWRLTH